VTAAPPLGLVIEPGQLLPHLAAPWLLLVDLCDAEVYGEMHIPGAVHLARERLVAEVGEATGELPGDRVLSQVLSSIGYAPRHHVVAYDDEGGGWASRLLWTLEAIGHARYSLLNGGLCAWLGDALPLSEEGMTPVASSCRVNRSGRVWVDRDYVLARLGDPRVVLLDARSPAEYAGRDARAARAGHIPGAVNLNWTEAMDPARKLRFRPWEVLRQRLATLGVTPDKEVIVYCHTHHRSSHTFVMLKALGFPRVSAYAGSWTEWGNREDTPIEAG